MTACEPVDRDTLQQFVITFSDQLTNCRQLLESHTLLLPVPQRVSLKPHTLSTSTAGAHNCASQASPHQGQFPSYNQSREGGYSVRGSPGDQNPLRPLLYDPITEPLQTSVLPLSVLCLSCPDLNPYPVPYPTRTLFFRETTLHFLIPYYSHLWFAPLNISTILS